MASNRTNKVVFRGETYPNLTELCKAYNITRQMIYYYNKERNIRQTKNESVEETLEWYVTAFDLKKNKDYSYEEECTFFYKGKGYKNFAQFCADNNYSTSSIKYIKRKYNISLEEAIDRVKNFRDEHRFTYKGKTYKSFSNFCKQNGIVPSYMFNKMKHDGTSREETVENYLREKKRRRDFFIFGDVRYKNLTECLNYYNIPAVVFRKQRDELGLSDQEAILHYLSTKDEFGKKRGPKSAFEFEGRRYNSYTECLREHNVTYYSVKSRIDLGMTREEALKEVLKLKEAKHTN